ncbi:MAG: hypothetical protein VSS75_011110 [Candidatus Parabeggiatoa sp.]|nr:hypothetical protein [Candidatus Parabeggiatoa sp.]
MSNKSDKMTHNESYLKYQNGLKSANKPVKLEGLWEAIPFDVTDEDVRVLRQQFGANTIGQPLQFRHDAKFCRGIPVCLPFRGSLHAKTGTSKTKVALFLRSLWGMVGFKNPLPTRQERQFNFLDRPKF